MNIHQLKQYIQNNLWHGENGRKPEPETPELLATVLAPPTGRVFGVDLSHWNIPPVDIPRMVNLFGMSFVIIKGCDGTIYSKYYFDHIEKAKEAGIPWGMYVWLYPGSKVSIDAQVNAWLLRYNVDKPPLGLFIDAEWTTYGGQPANPTAADLRLAHDRWKARSGTPATTYTAKGYADVYLSGFDWSREELWIANYGVSSPAMPNGATEWKWWQYTSQLDGLALDPDGNLSLDGNYYNGTAAEFAAKYLGGTVPPTNGGEMEYRKVLAFINIRPAAGNLTVDLGDLEVGDIIESDRKQTLTSGSFPGDWYHITKVTRAGGAVDVPAVDWWCWGKNTEAYVPPEPEPVVPVSMEVNLPKGATLTLTFSDGTKETWTA